MTPAPRLAIAPNAARVRSRQRPGAVTPGVTPGGPTAVPERSVGLPSVIAAAETAMTTAATRSADIRGTTLDERRMRDNFGTMELFGSGRSNSGSACLPDKIQ